MSQVLSSHEEKLIGHERLDSNEPLNSSFHELSMTEL